ncbi:hypothetical protein D7D25_06050 [Proteiniphilum sp. X52]|nr:hypothetical protein D7D25_06050 [Proteiniphilum sp. X52]
MYEIIEEDVFNDAGLILTPVEIDADRIRILNPKVVIGYDFRLLIDLTDSSLLEFLNTDEVAGNIGVKSRVESILLII